ncbi:MAG: SpoIIE family protein phosphatase [Thermoguttaceae bacterium]
MAFSLRNKLILAVSLPLLAVYLTVLALEYRAGRAVAIAQMERHLTALTGKMAAEIDRDMATAAQAARSAAATLTDFQPRGREPIDAMERSILATNSTIFGTAVAYEPGAFTTDRQRFAPYLHRGDAGGKLQGVEIRYDYTRWDWYLLPKLLGRPTWTDPYFDDGAGNILMCTYAAPFYRQGKFQGVVGVDIDTADIQRRLKAVDTHGGYCGLVSQTGTFVSHPNDHYIMGESIFSLAAWHELAALDAVGREMIAGKTGVRRLSDVETGRPTWVVFAPVRSVQWSLYAVIPDEAVMAEVNRRLNRQAAWLLGGLALIVAIIVAASTWVSRPIARLAAAAAQVARGNLDVRVADYGGHDEVGHFVTTFNQMVGDLRENIEVRVRETAARQTMERELQIAREIQTSLLPMARPPFPHRSEFTLDAETAPAKIMAGDFFDFWFVEDDVLALVMADVSGKGVPAALFMAVGRTVLRNFSVPGQSPAQVLTVANRVMAAQNEKNMFITLFYGHYHVKTGELVFANGGHLPPYVARQDGTLAVLDAPDGPLVGVIADAEYGERRTTLAPGEMLALYTDGATEARNADGLLLGDDGLRAMFAQLQSRPVDEVCQLVLEKINGYRSSPEQDDVSILALRRAAAG